MEDERDDGYRTLDDKHVQSDEWTDCEREGGGLDWMDDRTKLAKFILFVTDCEPEDIACEHKESGTLGYLEVI